MKRGEVIKLDLQGDGAGADDFGRILSDGTITFLGPGGLASGCRVVREPVAGLRRLLQLVQLGHGCWAGGEPDQSLQRGEAVEAVRSRRREEGRNRCWGLDGRWCESEGECTSLTSEEKQ